MNVVQPTTSSSNFLKSDPLQNSVGANENPATDKAPPQSSAPDGEGGSDDGSFDDLFDEPEGPPSNTAKVSSSFVTGPPVSTAPQIQQQQRSNIGGIAPPKNAPPLLTPDYYSIFSPDTLMTAAIDGQIVLWDKRVNTPGAGVGRLWMNEKTPPWCLSVSSERNDFYSAILTDCRLVGLQMEGAFMPEDAMEPLTSGMFASWVVRLPATPLGF